MEHRRPERAPERLQTTTLWHAPAQQMAGEPAGRPGYEGRTPAWVVWNLLSRYTRENDLVVDPFCGGGTTLDVAARLGRKARGFDLQPQRADIELADARALPLADESCDFFFMDPPYSTHIAYADDPRCLGKLDAHEGEGYFAALDEVFAEADRCLRDRRYLAVLVGDSFKKKAGFVGIGARAYELLERRFRPVDHVAVVRGNRKLGEGRFHAAAAEGNFFLRGFHHLLIFKKERGSPATRHARRRRS